MALVIITSLLLSAAKSSAPTQPAQPVLGPGGSKVKCAEVKMSTHGEGDQQYWIFQPDKPKLKQAPVIFFFHGWGGMLPDSYISWIEHLVKRGNIVVYPRYQGDFFTTNMEFFPNAVSACKAAIKTLQTSKDGTKPDLTRVAAVGHSVGGILAANITAKARQEGLPQPLALMSAEPGKTWRTGAAARFNTPMADLSKIPSSTLVLSVAGDLDTMVKDIDAKRIFSESTAVPRANKNLIIMNSDSHGEPPMVADHFAPCSHPQGHSYEGKLLDAEDDGKRSDKFVESGILSALTTGRPSKNSATVDAVDFYGFWRLFDALTDAAFYHTNRDLALGNTAKQRSMGTWSDGKAVKPLTVQ